MELAPGHASQVGHLSTVRETAAGSRPAHVPTGAMLLVAAWIGLVAGFLDLGILVVRKRFIDIDFYRMGDDFAWLIPLGVTILVLVPAILFALFATIARRPVHVGVAVGLLSFVGILDFTARLPISLWASMLLSAGLATQFARLIRPCMRVFLRLVRVTLPLLAGALLILMLATIGGRAWSEHQAAAALPPAPPGAGICS